MGEAIINTVATGNCLQEDNFYMSLLRENNINLSESLIMYRFTMRK